MYGYSTKMIVAGGEGDNEIDRQTAVHWNGRTAVQVCRTFFFLSASPIAEGRILSKNENISLPTCVYLVIHYMLLAIKEKRESGVGQAASVC